MKRLARRAAWISLSIIVTFVIARQTLMYIHQRNYPYGWSHCCLKGVGLALHVYADTNNGWFPVGGNCPEASLGILYETRLLDANTLRGKTVPLEEVESILDAGLPLTPDTCGWHYLEGLKSSDDPQIVVVWDKVGLGHNGQRLSRGGHSVLYIDGSESVISEAEWPAFLADQKNRIAAVNKSRRKP